VSRIAIEVSNVDDDADTITRIGELVAEERVCLPGSRKDSRSPPRMSVISLTWRRG
jgi:hypothetical protein